MKYKKISNKLELKEYIYKNFRISLELNLKPSNRFT